MKTIDLLQNRLFLDGYGSTRKSLGDVSTMHEIIRRTNQYVFAGAGIERIIPIKNANNPDMDGISGMVVAPGGHATVHTFSNIGCFFVDAYADRRYGEEYISQLVDNAYKPQQLDMSIGNHGDGVGFHVVVQLPAMNTYKYPQLVNRIVEAIQMKPLCGPMVCAQNNADYLQPITTSHIAVHRIHGGTLLDVFSCKGDNSSLTILEEVLDDFNLHPVNLIGVTRGINFSSKFA